MILEKHSKNRVVFRENAFPERLITVHSGGNLLIF